MAEEEYYVGVDVGTGSVRAGLVTRAGHVKVTRDTCSTSDTSHYLLTRGHTSHIDTLTILCSTWRWGRSAGGAPHLDTTSRAPQR